MLTSKSKVYAHILAYVMDGKRQGVLCYTKERFPLTKALPEQVQSLLVRQVGTECCELFTHMVNLTPEEAQSILDKAYDADVCTGACTLE